MVDTCRQCLYQSIPIKLFDVMFNSPVVGTELNRYILALHINYIYYHGLMPYEPLIKLKKYSVYTCKTNINQ